MGGLFLSYVDMETRTDFERSETLPWENCENQWLTPLWQVFRSATFSWMKLGLNATSSEGTPSTDATGWIADRA